MRRLLRPSSEVALTLGVVAATIIFGLALGSKIDDQTMHAGRSPRVTTTTVWLETQPTLGPRFGELVAAANAPKPKPKPKPKARPVARATSVGIWDRIAACESGGRWDDTRGGYEGGVHFLHSTWVKAGGRKYAEHAYQATREQQIEIAAGWLARTSWEQWPVCSRKVGAR